MQFKRKTVDERQRRAAAKVTASLRRGVGGDGDRAGSGAASIGEIEEAEAEEEDEEVVEAARLREINADRVLVPDTPLFTAYKRKSNSLYGNDTRRIFMPTMQG